MADPQSEVQAGAAGGEGWEISDPVACQGPGMGTDSEQDPAPPGPGPSDSAAQRHSGTARCGAAHSTASLPTRAGSRCPPSESESGRARSSTPPQHAVSMVQDFASPVPIGILLGKSGPMKSAEVAFAAETARRAACCCGGEQVKSIPQTFKSTSH